MAASTPWSGAPQTPPINDPNEMLATLRRIDQTTKRTYNLVTIGFVVLIVLGLVIIIVG
jgi:hypothetical protein